MHNRCHNISVTRGVFLTHGGARVWIVDMCTPDVAGATLTAMLEILREFMADGMNADFIHFLTFEVDEDIDIWLAEIGSGK